MRRKLQLKLGDVVEVKWLDTAFFLEPDESDFDLAQKDGGVFVFTLGYLRRITKRSITIFSEQFIDGTGKCAYTIIPRPIIYEINLLKKVSNEKA